MYGIKEKEEEASSFVGLLCGCCRRTATCGLAGQRLGRRRGLHIGHNVDGLILLWLKEGRGYAEDD